MKDMKNGRNKKVVVAMSGGVDSSVAAALLKQQGYFVVGVFMKLNRYSVKSEKLARLVAKKIGIPFYVINVEKEFKKKVVDYFLSEYKKGNTPNPCVVCNKEIKFGLLIEKALKMGADFVATGHYARLAKKPQAGNSAYTNFYDRGKSCRLDFEGIKLLKGKDKKKDQSYFLWQLNQKQLGRVLFPVGNYKKPEVRKLAKKFKLPTAKTPESQEVCFVQGITNEFLKKYLKVKSGRIIELQDVRHPAGCRTSQKTLGEHQGLWFYTIGQRRGIGLGGSASAKGFGETKPYYVVAKDFKKNILTVSNDKKDLLQKELIAKNVNWVSSKASKLPINAKVKIRYRSNLAKVKILDFYSNQKSRDSVISDPSFNGKNADKVKIIFQKPQQAITSGQSVVFYKGQQLLGGGVIE